MIRWLVVGVLSLVAVATRGGGAQQSADPVALLDRGLRHMGGRERVAAVTRVRLDMITMWQRIYFDDVPYPDVFPTNDGYEHNVEVRDYSIPAWRNTRHFSLAEGGQARMLVDLVRDSVAMYQLPGQDFQPQNIAYVDERNELFAYTPDRLMLWAREADDLAAAGDTVVAGVPHVRVRATVNGIPMTLYLRRADGLPTFVAFRKSAPNDFGLVPFGEMAVEVWYSRWRVFADGIRIPTEWDVRRAGAAYKRMTVLGAEFNPDFAPDSFAVTPEQRAEYLGSAAVRPMHDLPLDSARITEGFLADFHTFGSPRAALLMGDRWLLLEAGQAPLSTQRALGWLEGTSGKPVAEAVVGSTRGLFGGTSVLLDRQIPVVVAQSVEALVRASLEGYGERDRPLGVIEGGRWMRLGGDSVRVETTNLMDTRGTLLLWSPTHRWLYAPDVYTDLDIEIVMEHARSRGWQVERIGTGRELLLPAPLGGPSGAGR